MDDECRCELCVWYPPTPEPIPSITGNLESDIPMTQRYNPPERPAVHTVDIELNNAAHGTVLVDGQPVQNLLVGITLLAVPGRGPRVVLELESAVRLRSDSADVELGTDTEQLLKRLGWVPPMAPKVPVAQAGTDVQDSSGQPASENPA